MTNLYCALITLNVTNPPKIFVRAIIISSPQSICESTVQPDSSQDTRLCLWVDISVIGAPCNSFLSRNTTCPSSSGPNTLIDPLLLPGHVNNCYICIEIKTEFTYQHTDKCTQMWQSLLRISPSYFCPRSYVHIFV
jgi:hypothetical protein